LISIFWFSGLVSEQEKYKKKRREKHVQCSSVPFYFNYCLKTFRKKKYSVSSFQSGFWVENWSSIEKLLSSPLLEKVLLKFLFGRRFLHCNSAYHLRGHILNSILLPFCRFCVMNVGVICLISLISVSWRIWWCLECFWTLNGWVYFQQSCRRFWFLLSTCLCCLFNWKNPNEVLKITKARKPKENWDFGEDLGSNWLLNFWTLPWIYKRLLNLEFMAVCCGSVLEIVPFALFG